MKNINILAVLLSIHVFFKKITSIFLKIHDMPYNFTILAINLVEYEQDAAKCESIKSH